MHWLQRINPARLLRARRPGGSAGASRASVNGQSVSDLIAAAANLSGVRVTEKSALTLAAAFACVNVIATDAACLPRRVMKRRKGGGSDVATDHELTPLLSVSPDGETTPSSSVQALYGHALGWGNGYYEIERDGAGRPVKLHVLDPSTTSARRRKSDGRLYYLLDGGDALLPHEVFHFAGMGFDGLVGYSPVKLARQSIGLGLAAETFGAALFGNGSNSRGVLTTDQELNDDVSARLREQFDRVHGSGPHNAHRTLILEQGMKWQQTSVNPEDAQFLATRQFQVLEVCRIYRVPPHKVADLSEAHLANIEASNLDYVCNVLLPWCVKFEQQANLKLLTDAERRAGFYVDHSLGALLRGNMAARAEFYTKLRDLGVLTPNMVCDLEGFNPIGPDGDIRLVPLNMTSLANAGKAITVSKRSAQRLLRRLLKEAA